MLFIIFFRLCKFLLCTNFADIHVEVERDVDDEMEMDISDPKDEEEDVVRCLCGVLEDSGLMIQVRFDRLFHS